MADDLEFPRMKGGLASKIGAIKPSADVSVEPVPLERIDELAARHGFTSREAVVPYRRDRSLGPLVALNMRAPIRVANPFQRFCEENRFSYWEGIEELMKRAGVV